MKVKEKDSIEDEKMKRIADHNWQKMEKENKPTALAPVFKGAELEREKGMD